MVTIIALFALLSGFLASLAYARSKELDVKSISYFIFGFVVIYLSTTYFNSDNTAPNLLFPYVLVGILAFHFFIGEITKSKIGIIWNFIPPIAAALLFLGFDFEGVTYMDFKVETNVEIVLISLLSSITPFLTHLAKLGIGNLIIRFGSIKWAENEENYLESLVSYAFIGGVAALGSFLLGPLGLLIAATFHLSASFIARNKLGLKNTIILSASSALFLLVLVPIYIKMGGFEQLNFLRGEVIEGAFLAGFMVIAHHLFLKLSRFNTGKWNIILSSIAVVLPLITIFVVGVAYTQFERLGGVLAISGMLVSLALLSVTFSLFKNSSFISLKLMTIGMGVLLLPYIKPVEQVSAIDYESLGIEQEEQGEEEPKGKSLSAVVGDWKIDENHSKIYFELGPDDGRTKGEFKSVSGQLNVNENISESIISVTLLLNQLTTYIDFRDEELMGKEYFKADEFPEITFKGSEFTPADDYYVVKGDFTMMGVTKELELNLKLMAIGESEGAEILVFSGDSKIDRTDFGMSPSSKIGNVVDFKIEVQMSKAN